MEQDQVHQAAALQAQQRLDRYKATGQLQQDGSADASMNGAGYSKQTADQRRKKQIQAEQIALAREFGSKVSLRIFLATT